MGMCLENCSNLIYVPPEPVLFHVGTGIGNMFGDVFLPTATIMVICYSVGCTWH